MIIKLLIGILVIVFTVCFAGFNLDNKCDVSLIFYTFKDANVTYVILISFVLGFLITIPAMITNHFKRRKEGNKTKSPEKEKKSFFGKKTGKSGKTPSDSKAGFAGSSASAAGQKNPSEKTENAGNNSASKGTSSEKSEKPVNPSESSENKVKFEDAAVSPSENPSSGQVR